MKPLATGLSHYDIVKDATFELYMIDFRVPKRGELYLDKNLKVQVLKEDRIWSSRAKPRVILQARVNKGGKRLV